jgi:MFS family permease
MQAEHGQPTQQPDWPPATRAWALVFVLLAAYAIAFVDRQILSLLVEPVRRDLAISDTQFSLLAGVAFTLFYSVMGIPCAWLADRGSRRNLVFVSMLFWSAMTAACGFAASFATLFAARIGVGIGEAGLSPAAYSMISDSFAPERRARAIGAYNIGAIGGVGIAFIIGGSVVQWAINAPPIELPGIGVLAPWQLAFLLVSLPGPLLALLLLAFREPKRQEGVRAPTDGAPEFTAFLRERGLLFALIAVGFSLVGVSLVAYLMWTPAFMVRRHGWDIGTVGLVYGSILIVGCTSGILIGSAWAERLLARGQRDAFLRVGLVGALTSLPFAIAAPFAPSGEWAMACLAAMALFYGLTQGMPAAALQAIAPNRVRARTMALFLLTANIVSFTIGPTGAALISDYVLRDPTQIGVAIAMLCAVVVPLGALAIGLARGRYVAATSGAGH